VPISVSRDVIGFQRKGEGAEEDGRGADGTLDLSTSIAKSARDPRNLTQRLQYKM